MFEDESDEEEVDEHVPDLDQVDQILGDQDKTLEKSSKALESQRRKSTISLDDNYITSIASEDSILHWNNFTEFSWGTEFYFRNFWQLCSKPNKKSIYEAK